MADDIEKPGMTPGQAVQTYNRILKSGDEAWEKWIDLGHFIIERTRTAAAKAGATRGTTYSACLHKALGQFAPIYQKLSNNGTLTNLGKCMAKLDEVNAYRELLRKSEAATEPPSHPQRMWAAFEARQMGSISFEDDGEDESDEGDDKPARRKNVGRSHNTEKELLAEIDRLREQLDEQRLSIDPTMNADRIWRHLVEVLGHNERAGELAVKTGEQLAAIGRRIVEAQQEWDQGGREQG